MKRWFLASTAVLAEVLTLVSLASMPAAAQAPKAAAKVWNPPRTVYEYACHEGNYSMFTTLSGARALEKSLEEAAKKGSR